MTRAGTTDPVRAPDDTAELAIGGMTCAACAARIEKKLNRLDGVSASVNYATGTASVSSAGALPREDITATIERLGYTAAPPVADTAHDGVGDLPLRLLVAVALAVPVMIMSMVTAAQFRGWQWVALALTTPVVLWSAWPIHVAALRHLRQRATNMDTLVSLGVAAAYGWSLWALLATDAGRLGMQMEFTLIPRRTDADAAHVYFEVAAMVVALILLGRFLEARATSRAGDAVRALAARGAGDAMVLRDGPGGQQEHRVPVEQVAPGDHFVVRPGERIATDGTVVQGAATVDVSLLTGESRPEDVGVGDAVVGSSVNTSGRLVVRATAVGADTRLARIGRLVAEAQRGKADIARLADRVSAVFVPVVLGIALITLGGHLLAGTSVDGAVTSAVAVLVIACPCALGLATPTALLVGTGRGAQLGILIRGPRALEATRHIDTVLLDKTGTLTSGRMSVTGVHVAEGVDPHRFATLVGATESASEHPIGRAIAAHLGSGGASPAHVAADAGAGIAATVDGVRVRVGRLEWLDATVPPPPASMASAASAAARGATVVWAAFEQSITGVVTVSDSLKPDAAATVDGLRALGIRPQLVTGDRPDAAATIGTALGFTPAEIHAGVRPEGKLALVEALQADGRRVAMVGDGLNDGAALARADLGLAMSTGTDVAMEASDITLVDGRVSGIVDAIRLARRVLGTIRGNLFWAFAYNVAAIPAAALGFLNPMIAAAAMAFSSLFVVGNSLRLRRFTPSS